MSLGKFKFTLAVARQDNMCLRAGDEGKRAQKCLVCLFAKGSEDYGELESSRVLGITVMQFGRPSFVDQNPTPDVELAKKGFPF